jgi:uridine kinase
LIGGGSASGKTTIAHKLKCALAEKGVTAQCISMDNFYRSLRPDEDGDTFNWDDPSSYDVDTLIECIGEWSAGRGCWIPQHDFSTYRSIERAEYCNSVKVMIIEGIHALSIDRLLACADLKIYVHADHDEALARRIVRDIKERGYGIELILKRYFQYVKPALKGIIEPSQKNADFIIVNHDKHNTKDVHYEGVKAIELIASAFHSIEN